MTEDADDGGGMPPTLDLTERLATAAADAVRKRRGAIEDGGVRNLRGLMVELELANGGAVVDVTSHLSWRDVVREAKRRER